MAADRPDLGFGLTTPVQEGLTGRDYLELATLAEEEGLHTVLTGEIAGIEAFALLGAIASSTSRVRIGTGIVPIYNRSPALSAMAFTTLDALAPGRVIAGFGTGSHRIVEDWNGRELRAPIETTRDFVEIFRAVLTGERVDHEGSELSVREFRLQHPAPARIPLFLGAFNPRMLRLAGAIADGVMLALWPAAELQSKVAAIHEGARAAGRDPGSLEITASIHGYAGPHVDEAVDRLRRLVLEYAVRPTHRAAYVASFPEIDRATELWNAGERKQALALVPDGAVHSLYAIGDADTLTDRLEQARAAGVTLPVLLPHALRSGDPEAPRTTLRAVAAAVRERGGLGQASNR